MNPIDKLADERDKLKAKLNQAKTKLKKAKVRIEALKTERLRLSHVIHRADTANVRARAMICDAAGIQHDADILEWISVASKRIARMEMAGNAMADWFGVDSWHAKSWRAAKEAKP